MTAPRRTSRAPACVMSRNAPGFRGWRPPRCSWERGAGQIRVSEPTAKRIREAADALGYRPNPTASHLAGRKSGIIAIAGHDWRNFLAQRVLVHLHEAAEPHGFRVVATRLAEGVDSLVQLERDLRAGWIDGVVFLAHENEALWPAAVEVLGRTSSSVIAVGDLQAPGVTSIISDVTVGARQTIEHVCDRGCRRPVFLFEQVDTPDIQSRLRAYETACELRGIEFGPQRIVVETRDWLLGEPAYYPRFDALTRLLVDDLQADCVICDTDFNASALIAALRRLGKMAPRDVSIVGWGNLQFSKVFDPTITTVEHDLPEVMNRVIENLRETAESGTESRPIHVPTRLIVRESA